MSFFTVLPDQVKQKFQNRNGLWNEYFTGISAASKKEGTTGRRVNEQKDQP